MSGRIFLLLALASEAGRAQAEPPSPVVGEPEELSAGLLVSYGSKVDAASVSTRVVPDLAADWGRGSPDPRVAAEEFAARWAGYLLIQAPGAYRFSLRTDGTAELRVTGRAVARGSGGTSDGGPIELRPGFAPIVLEYRHHRGEARMAVDWRGPTFGLEPVPARLLYHDPGSGGTTDPFEAGRRLAADLGCANCHALPEIARQPHLGPPLGAGLRSLKRGWLAAWIADPANLRPQTPMPSFGAGLSPGEVGDLLAFLAGPAAPAPRPSDEIRMALNVASPSKGRLHFRSLGCLGCHSKEKVGNRSTSRAVRDLSDLGKKIEPLGLAGYLVHPRGSGSSAHRADLRLTPDEAAHLAAYLITDPPQAPASGPPPAGDAARGRRVAIRLRCASCHATAGLEPPAADLPLDPAHSHAGCLAREVVRENVPRFALTDSEREALRAYVAKRPARPSPPGPDTVALDLIRRRNCFGCHAREGIEGPALGSRLAPLLGTDPELGALKGTLTPPNLSAVGDKLRPEYLSEAVGGHAPTARPWLTVRMPAFAYEPGEAEAIAAYFRRHDRVGDSGTAAGDRPRPLPVETVPVAAQLVGRQGFGCLSCHVVAGRIPPGGEPETMGPDLILSHRRMTERYFRRWLDNPQRIIAGTPMPQFVKPIATIPGTLEQQLGLVWDLLGSPGAVSAASSASRELVKRDGDRAAVVFDMVVAPDMPGDRYTPRGVAIGLKNDHALLFDADRIAWLAWWDRGFLSRTKSGRLWEWHPEGRRLWTAPSRRPPVVFLAPDGALHLPEVERDRFGHLASIAFEGPGVALSYDLNGPRKSRVRVAERIQPQGQGWEREVGVTGVPAPWLPALLESPPPRAGGDTSAEELSWPVSEGAVRLEVAGMRADRAKPAAFPDATLYRLEKDAQGTYRGTVRLETQRRRAGGESAPARP